MFCVGDCVMFSYSRCVLVGVLVVGVCVRVAVFVWVCVLVFVSVLVLVGGVCVGVCVVFVL